MLCAISGEAPQVPVASRKSGNVYEKRLIEEYIAQYSKEPITNEELTLDDLVELKNARTVRPRPPTLTSIPSLLNVFQKEWDALALETFNLRQTLLQTRQELSTALYQHDAAVRVIARLTKERDEARQALSRVSVGASAGDAMAVDSVGGLPEAIVAKVEATQASLSKTRRKRPVPEDWATGDAIQEFKPAGKSEIGLPGKSLAVNTTGELALIGGANGAACVYAIGDKQVLQQFETGSAVTDAIWAGSKAVVATSSGAVKIFEGPQEVASFSTHAGPATALALHPSGDLVASVGVDKSYVIYDLESNKSIAQVFTDSSLSTVKFHPDGHIVAVGGADGQIKVFDVKTGESMATFEASSPLQALDFSENGIWLAAVTKGSTSVSIWDLRKGSEIKALETGNQVETIKWDYTGQFLLTGGPSGTTVQQYSKAAKDWSEPLRTGVPALGLAWGQQAKDILVLGDDSLTTISA